MTNYKAKDAYKNKSVASSYDEDRFKSLKGKIEDKLEKTAIEKALSKISGIQTVLDIPCGTGRITEFLLSKGFKLTGLDISGSMIDVAKERLKQFSNLEKLAVGDAENILFGDSSYDLVTSIRFFGHIPHDTKLIVLREFMRISKKYIIVGYAMKNTIRGYERKLLKGTRMWFPVTKREIFKEANHTGLIVEGIFPIFFNFSETYIVLFSKKKINENPSLK